MSWIEYLFFGGIRAEFYSGNGCAYDDDEVYVCGHRTCVLRGHLFLENKLWKAFAAHSLKGV